MIRFFEKGYPLKSLGEVEQHIKKTGHLPGVPSAVEVVEQGVDVAGMDAKLLEKVEELTLYLIELKKANDNLQRMVTTLQDENKLINQKLQTLTTPITSIMKQFVFSIALLALLPVYCQAQTVLTQQVEAGQQQQQHSATRLEARNLIANLATADYTAVQAVTLQPGFTAQAGSVFSARIATKQANSGESSRSLSLTAYPNPFIERTQLEYNLPVSAQVNYRLTNVQGQVIGQQSGSNWQESGRHQLNLSGSDLPQGVYLYHIQVGADQKTIRLIKQP